jgi:hypothetical protein
MNSEGWPHRNEADIDDATLCRFMGRAGGMTVETLDKLAEFLGLEITVRQTDQKKGK